MNLEFLPEAQAEFKRAINYYEGKEKGLGKRLRDEVREVCSAIQDHPSIWREREGGFRRVTPRTVPLSPSLRSLLLVEQLRFSSLSFLKGLVCNY